MKCPECAGPTRVPISRLTDQGRRYLRVRACTSSRCGWRFATSEVAPHKANRAHSLKRCKCGARMTTSGTAQTIDGGRRVLRVRFCEKRCGHEFVTFEEREGSALEDDSEPAPAPRARAAAR